MEIEIEFYNSNKLRFFPSSILSLIPQKKIYIIEKCWCQNKLGLTLIILRLFNAYR
jgi:hypothetical protein